MFPARTARIARIARAARAARSTRAAGCALFWLACATLPAQAANTLTALAYQNLGGRVQDVSTALQASATVGQASAFASRSQVRAITDGQGTGPQTHFGASAGSISDYSLWDMGRNLPLDPVAAQTMELVFNFELVGRLTVEEVPQSVAATRYVGGLDYLSGRDNFEGALSVSYGNVVPFPNLGYTSAGDLALWGSYSLSFSARHRGATAGVITFIVANTSANVAQAASTMTLASVGLLRGTLPDGGLGVRLTATGLTFPVSPVPEPGSLALWLSGLGLCLGAARRRGGFSR